MRNRGRASSHEIREELDRTRASLDRAFGALGAKLTPASLFWDGMGVFRSGAGSAISRAMHLAQQHPLPASVIGLGVGWLLIENARSGRADGTYEGTPAEQYGGGYGSARPGTWAGTPVEQGEFAGGRYPSAAAGYSGGDAAGGAGYETGGPVARVKETAGEAVHRAGEMASRAGERVTETAESVKEGAARAASTVKEQASRAAGTVREQAAQAVGTVREQAAETAEAVRAGASRAGERARRTARRAGGEFDRLLREEPLAVGLGALAVGVLAGLMLPATRREDEMLGEARDRKVDRAREAAREALDRGKQVARTAVDRAKETVKEEVERQQLTPRAVAERVVGGQGQQAPPPGTGQPGPTV
ncbi:MAG TPA: hypothetical protein VIG50_20095 [Vicinamibacteria bacterium]